MNTIINYLFAAIKGGAPILFGTTGEILNEKSGSLNLGVEGMMALGAVGSYYCACKTGSLVLCILAAFIAAALGAALFAFFTVTIRANQNVTGLTLTILGTGICGWLVQSMRDRNIAVNPAVIDKLSDKGIPVLKDIPVIGPLFFSHGIMVYIALIVALLCWIYIRFTKAGLRMRAVGENPGAADAVGININLVKYLNIIIGGGIAGLGGLYQALVVNGGKWFGNWINGIGWISIALVIFSSWSPALAIIGSLFFGLLSKLQAYSGNLAVEFPSALGWLSKLPNELYLVLPYLITAIVLAISSIRGKSNKQPSAIGINYFREER